MPTSPINKPIIMIGVLFFIFGFITWVCSVLIPYLQLACELNNFQAQLVSFAFYISYFVMAVPSGWILKYTGFKKGISLGLFIMMVGCLFFIPAAISRQYPVFLIGLFIQGTGLAILQTAANPYVTILGPKESAARRMSIMGICNGVAGIIAPIILGKIVLENADALKDKIDLLPLIQKKLELNFMAEKVILPYIVIAVILLALSIWFYVLHLPEPDAETIETSAEGNTKKNIFQFPNLILGTITLFAYVGVEVIAGNTIISYGAWQGTSLHIAKFFTSFTLCCMLLGYVIGIICIPKYFSQEQSLKYSAILGIGFTLATLSTSGIISVVFVALLGLSNSLMWPAIWPLAIEGLGKFTKAGAALLIVAIGGGAIIPLIYGKIADSVNPQQAYWIVIPCYLIIGFFAWYGHKLRNWKSVKI